MDRSRFKRAATQTQHQISKQPFENQPPAQRVLRQHTQTPVVRRSYINTPVPASRMAASQPVWQSGSSGAQSVAAQPRRRRLPAMAVAATVVPPANQPNVPAVAAARRVPIDMELPGEKSLSPFDAQRRHAKWRNFRRQASRGMAVAIVLVITLGGLLFSQSYLKLHHIFRGGADTAAALKSNARPDLLKGEGRGRVNILLLGRGGPNHDAPDLTDTIMLASVDPVNHTAALLSLPRDLWVNVPDQGVMKLNAAFETGEFKYLGKESPGTTDPNAIKSGFKMVDKTVEDVTGVTVDYNVMVDFKAFQQAINTVGGVDVNVPAPLVDPTMAWENGGNPTLAAAGPQIMNGQKALIYVRSRETSSDFARAERQRAVLLALKSKIQALGTLSNPIKISGLMDAFGDNIQTDLSLSNANRLYKILKRVNSKKITSVGLNGNPGSPGAVQYVTTGNLNGQSIVLPKAGLFKYDAIRQYIRMQLKDPYLIKEKAKVMVLNGTGLPGLASAKAKELKTYGYNVIKVGNTPSGGWTATTLIDLTHGKKKYTRHFLEKRLDTKPSNSLEDTSIRTNGADFVIIIGSDEANTAQN